MIIYIFSCVAGRKTLEVADKEMMDTLLSESHHEMVGVVFHGIFSYQLKFNWRYGIPTRKEHSEYSGNYRRIDTIFFAVFIKPQLGTTDRNIDQVKKRDNILFIQLSNQCFL